MKSKIKIGLVQINNSFSNQSYFPYSVGIFQACVEEYLEESDQFEFLLPVYSRIPVKEAVERLAGADIICFSVYVWNIRISLKIAQEAKKQNPAVLIIFGGPQVPAKNTECFLRSNPFIDIACHGEGEAIFPSILGSYLSGLYSRRNWKDVAGLSYIDEAGKFIRTAECPRISELGKISSPYLKGVFEPLMKQNPQTEWVALWETNRGCPFSCAYCDWGSAVKNKVYQRGLKELFKEIDWFSKNKIEFIFCCDANFGIFERDVEIVGYMAENKRRYGYPKALSVQNTKNFTEESYQIYKLMSDSGLSKGVSLSLQSLNKETLENIGRSNVSIETFKKVQEKLTSFNTETFTDFILGLPCETYESFVSGAAAVAQSGQHNRIQFNNLSILPNAPMGDIEYQKKFGFDIVETKIINIHGALAGLEDIPEKQRLVVGTSAMPRKDWVKTRVFGWMMSLLYFDKLLQVPFVILNKSFGVGFRELVEVFTEEENLDELLLEVRKFFTEKALDIQNGGLEFCESKEWLNIWWPADELALIKLCSENKLHKFYEAAERALNHFLDKESIGADKDILKEAVFLNQNLMKLPFQKQDRDIQLSYNIWQAYRAALSGEAFTLNKGSYSYVINRSYDQWDCWQDWCRKVVWYGNKKGAYMYGCKALPAPLEAIRLGRVPRSGPLTG